MNALKELRKSRKLNQKDIADYLGITQQAYQKYEYGTSEMSGSTITKLADFYGVTTDYLLGRETSNPFEGVSLDEEDIEFFTALANLPSNIRKCTLQLLFELLKETKKNQD